MKTFRFALLGACALLAAACAKVMEEAPEVTADKPEVTAPVHKITAVIDNDDITKTAYDGETQFGWVAEDRIRLIVMKDGISAYNYHYDYKADTDGSSSTFTATGTPDWNTYDRSGIAVYPQLAHGWFAANSYHTVTLPQTYTVSGDNFMSIIPLIGIQDELNEDLYHFKTAVGVLKLRLSNVPVSACKLVLTAPDTGDPGANNLSGTFLLPTPANGIEMPWMNSVYNTVTVEFPQQTAGSTITVYIPVPVGTISAGATFSVQTSDGTPIMTTPETLRDIPVERNVLLDLTPNNPISVEKWEDLGEGLFIDNHTFWQANDYDGGVIDCFSDYFTVTIQRHATDPNRYRVVNPYGMLFDELTHTEQYGTGPDDYLTFTVDETLGADIVVNDSFHTGIRNYGYDYELWYNNPYWYSGFYYNNRIIKKDGEGNILNVQLAPYYKGALDEDNSQSPKIEIVFPGGSPMLGGYFNYANSTSASYSEGVVTATVGVNVTAVKVKAALSIAAGVEALLSDDVDLTFTESGNKDLGGLAHGNYYLVYKVETEGHGFTFKLGNQFSIWTEIPLTDEMISVNVDAGSKDGLKHYDGTGKGALVDNNTSTFWHTPWESKETVWEWYGPEGSYGTIFDNSYTVDDIYDYSDLDGYYGAYIEIDLGGSKTVTQFGMGACLRVGTGSYFPKSVEIYTSTDKSSWKMAGSSENVSSGKNAGEWINTIECVAESAARYIRFCIITNTSDKNLWNPSESPCTHLAELKLYE